MTGQTLSEEVCKIPFADLTVKCEGKTFQAHRVLVCRKSEVLTKALVGQFTEAKTQELVLNDTDAETVERMLLFCYVEDYDDGSETVESLEDSRDLDNEMSLVRIDAASTQSSLDGGASEVAFKVHDGDRLMKNALVYSIADKYAIDSLKNLAKKKFQSRAAATALPRDFVIVVRDVFNTTPPSDRGLRDIVIDKCMKHLDTLLQDPAFVELLGDEAQLATNLFQHEREEHISSNKNMLSVVDAHVQQIQQLKMDLFLAEMGEKRSNEQAIKMREIVNKTRGCRHCGAEFSCKFDIGENFMRCTDCRTKHH